jgi:predicted N-acetyltransferase YhbS
MRDVELESMSVLPDYQRQGIASSMITIFLEDVNKDNAGTFVRSSIVGRKLYERFGWKVLGELKIDLREFGMEEMNVSFMMQRDSVKSAEAKP